MEKLNMIKLKSSWVKNWSMDDVITRAVSLGIEFMAGHTPEDVQTIKKNKKVLVKRINDYAKKQKT